MNALQAASLQATAPHGCYRMRRVFWIVWRWQVEHAAAPRLQTGLSLGRAAARRAGACRLEKVMLRFQATPSRS